MPSRTLNLIANLQGSAAERIAELNRNLQQLPSTLDIEIRSNSERLEALLSELRGGSIQATVDLTINRTGWDALRRETEQGLRAEVRLDLSRAEAQLSGLGARLDRELRGVVRADVRTDVRTDVSGGGGGGGLDFPVPFQGIMRALGSGVGLDPSQTSGLEDVVAWLTPRAAGAQTFVIEQPAVGPEPSGLDFPVGPTAATAAFRGRLGQRILDMIGFSEARARRGAEQALEALKVFTSERGSALDLEGAQQVLGNYAQQLETLQAVLNRTYSPAEATALIRQFTAERVSRADQAALYRLLDDLGDPRAAEVLTDNMSVLRTAAEGIDTRPAAVAAAQADLRRTGQFLRRKSVTVGAPAVAAAAAGTYYYLSGRGGDELASQVLEAPIEGIPSIVSVADYQDEVSRRLDESLAPATSATTERIQRQIAEAEQARLNEEFLGEQSRLPGLGPRDLAPAKLETPSSALPDLYERLGQAQQAARGQALSALRRVTGLSSLQATRYLSVLSTGDPRLVDEAAELYLLYYNALREQEQGRPPTATEVTRTIYEALNEEGAAFSFTEAGGFPAAFVDLVAPPRLYGEFSKALKLHPSITVPFDDVLGGIALGRSITRQAIETGVQSPTLRANLIQRTLAGARGDLGRQLTGELQTVLEERLRTQVQASLAALNRGDVQGALDAIKAGYDQGAFSLSLKTAYETVSNLQGLTAQHFEDARTALAPLVRPYTVPPVDLSATQEGRIRQGDDIRLRAENRAAGILYADRLAQSGYTQTEVLAELLRVEGLTPARLDTLSATEPGERYRYYDTALSRLEARGGASRPSVPIQSSGYDVLYTGVDEFSQRLAASRPSVPIQSSGYDVLYTGVDEFSQRLAALPGPTAWYQSRWAQQIGTNLADNIRRADFSSGAGWRQFGTSTAAQSAGIYVSQATAGALTPAGGQIAGSITERLLGEILESLTTGDGWLARIVGLGEAQVAPADVDAFGTRRVSSSASIDGPLDFPEPPIINENHIHLEGAVIGDLDELVERVAPAMEEAANRGTLSMIQAEFANNPWRR